MRYAIERKRTQEQIKSLNAELERRVAERTEELSTANEALARANRELRQFDRMKSAFIDVTSHELRTPVLSIRGMLHVLRRRIPQDPDLLKAVEAAIRGARRLEGIAGAHARGLPQGPSSCAASSLKPVDPKELVENVAQTISPIVELRNQQLTVAIEGEPPSVPSGPRSHPRRPAQPRHERHQVHAGRWPHRDGSASGERPRALLGDRQRNRHLAESDQPHVFEEFFTTFDTPHHSSGEYGFLKRGIGLGLAIVKNFVELHEGEVTMESEVGKGSTFAFTVPIDKGEEE